MEPSTKREELSQELRDFLDIQRMVRKCLALYLDQDNVAGNIWLELWQKSKEKGEHIQPIWTHVRNRCIDEVRRMARKREVPLEGARTKCVETSEERDASRDNQEFLDLVMECPSLSSKERLLLYKKYYAEMSLRDLSGEIGKSKTSTKRRFREIIDKIRSWVIESGLENGLEKEEQFNEKSLEE